MFFQETRRRNQIFRRGDLDIFIGSRKQFHRMMQEGFNRHGVIRDLNPFCCKPVRFLQELRGRVQIGVVGGSDYSKIAEQLGEGDEGARGGRAGRVEARRREGSPPPRASFSFPRSVPCARRVLRSPFRLVSSEG